MKNYRELAIINREIYKDLNVSKANYGLKTLEDLNYKVKEISSLGIGRNGFFAMLLEKDGMHIIAVQGTKLNLRDLHNSSGDLSADINLYLNRLPSIQYAQLNDFVRNVKEKHDIKIDLFTGHSLGGALAAFSAINEGSEVVTFDSPGIRTIAETTFPKIDEGKILNFISDINLISGTSRHIGKIVQLHMPEEKYDLKTLSTFHPSSPSAPQLIGGSVNLMSVELRQKYYLDKLIQKAVFDKLFENHSITKISEMFDQHGQIIVPHMELDQYGGNIHDTLHMMSNYYDSAPFWEQAIKSMHQHAVFSQLDYEEFKDNIVSNYLANGNLANQLIGSGWTGITAKYATIDSSYKSPNLHHFEKQYELLNQYSDIILKGGELSKDQYNQGISIAQSYFIKNQHSNRDEAYKYNYEFVTGRGEIGSISNKALKDNCQINGINSGEVRCNYSKILLTKYNIDIARENGNAPLSTQQHDLIRERALLDAGLNSKADVRNLVSTLSGNKTANFNDLNQAIDLVKDHIEFGEDGSKINFCKIKDEQHNNGQILTGLASFKNTVVNHYGLRASASGSDFLAHSKEHLTSRLGINNDAITYKFGNDINPDSLPQNSQSHFVKQIFSVNTAKDPKQKPAASIKVSDNPVMQDPEFIIKLATSPISTIKPAEIVAMTRPSMASASNPQLDNSRLHVEISQDIYSKRSVQSKSEINNLWREGVASLGGHHEVLMPPTILNGDGYINVRPSSITTGGWRPGAQELSTFSADKTIQKMFHPRAKLEVTTPVINEHTSRMLGMNINRCKIKAFNELNIDPLVVDIAGKGLELSHWETNGVLFDMDGDGYLEQTGWVRGNTALLVMGNTEEVTSIHQLLSEKFQGKEFTDGFEALRQFDKETKGFIDASNPIFSKLKLWFDISGDGVCREGELKSLEECGIEQIILPAGAATITRNVNGNIVKRTTTLVMKNGVKGTIASVDFVANDSGHKFEQTEHGVRIVSKGKVDKIIENDLFQKIKIDETENSTSSFISSDIPNLRLDSTGLNVENLIAIGQSATLIGNDQDNWLVGGPGSNIYQGNSGNNSLVINEHDKQEHISGGTGFNTVFINATKGRYFSLAESNIAVLYGSEKGDVIDASSAGYNCFIQAGKGNNLIYGAKATSVLAGGSNDDIIQGGSGGGILRANSGNNLLIANGGNNILESGIGFNYLRGGVGSNVFQPNAKGYSICDGSKGKLNILQLPASIYDYSMEYNNKGHVIVRNKNYYDEFSAVLINIQYVNFKGMRNFDFNCVLPQKWIMPKEFEGLSEISISELMKYQFSPLNEKVGLKAVQETKGCTLTACNGKNLLDMEEIELFQLTKFYLTYEKEYVGPVYIKYSPGTATHLVNFYYKLEDGSMIQDNAASILVLKGKIQDVDNYYLNQLRTNILQKENYLGQGIKVQVCESNTYHADGVSHIIRQIVPKAELYFTDRLFSSKHEGMDVLNFSVSFHSPLKASSELNISIGFTDAETLMNLGVKNMLSSSREGLGLPAIFGSGNERCGGGDANYDLIKSLPQVIVVGAINRENIIGMSENLVKQFSNPGSNILVSAPGVFMPITTRGIKNEFGNYFQDNYTISQGTSFSAPIVTAVVSALLQVNKHLSVYDIKKILAYSANAVESDSTWNFNDATTWNGGGLHYSYDFGFGCIDVHNAVLLAKNWLVGQRQCNQNTWLLSTNSLITENSISFSTEAKVVGEIISTSINFFIQEIDIYKLKLDVMQDGKIHNVLKPKMESNLSDPILMNVPLTPLTYSLFGSTIKEKIGCKFENKGNKSIEFGCISIKTISIKDNNTNFIFTDEFIKFYDKGRSMLEAKNEFNTINLAPITYVTQVNLDKGQMYLLDKLFTLKGYFQNIICSDANSTVVGNEQNNIIICNGFYSEVSAVSGHNIVSTSSTLNSTSKLISGSRADMFVIKKAPGSVTIIESFKAQKFDQGADNQLYSDIIALGAFKDINSVKDLKLDKINDDRVMYLPEDQKVIIKNTSTLYGYNFKFTKGFNIVKQFSEPAINNDIFTNLIFGFDIDITNDDNITEMIGAYNSSEFCFTTS